jgi:hypothetical protein
MSSTITFKMLCQWEPRLRELELEAKAIEAGNDFCANEVWYRPGGLKSWLRKLVGNEGCHPTLRTSEAYHVVYQHLWTILLDCQHEGICL